MSLDSRTETNVIFVVDESVEYFPDQSIICLVEKMLKNVEVLTLFCPQPKDVTSSWSRGERHRENIQIEDGDLQDFYLICWWKIHSNYSMIKVIACYFIL